MTITSPQACDGDRHGLSRARGGDSARRRDRVQRGGRPFGGAPLRAGFHALAGAQPLVVLRVGAALDGRVLGLAPALWLALPSLALASTTEVDEESFDPSHEWELQTWGPELKLGPIDMSINKAVAYLLLGALISCVIGILFMRLGRRGSGPTRPARSASRSTRSRAGTGRRAGAFRRRRSVSGSRTWPR